MKEDAIKTLTVRKEAILAELVGDNEQGKGEEEEKRKSWKTFKLMFPRRIWFKDDKKKYELSEIVFPEENEEEAKENLKEIWGEEMILTMSDSDNKDGEEFKPISTTTKAQNDDTSKSVQKSGETKRNNEDFNLFCLYLFVRYKRY